MTRYVEGSMPFCWACDLTFWPDITPAHCDKCGAPQWEQNGQSDARGVYIVQASCALTKIGVSRRVRGRVDELSAHAGETLRLLAGLRGADGTIETWLHRCFADTRDPSFAWDEGLPAHTEWFWPTPSLLRLADNRGFLIDGLRVEDAAAHGLDNMLQADAQRMLNAMPDASGAA